MSQRDKEESCAEVKGLNGEILVNVIWGGNAAKRAIA